MPTLTLDTLRPLFIAVHSTDHQVAYVVLNAADFADLRKSEGIRDLVRSGEFAMRSATSELRRGWMTTIWGAQVYTSRLIPKGTALVTPELLEPGSAEWIPSVNYLVEIPEPPEPIPRVPGRTAWERLIEDDQ